jgi:hypothetical protein
MSPKWPRGYNRATAAKVCFAALFTGLSNVLQRGNEKKPTLSKLGSWFDSSRNWSNGTEIEVNFWFGFFHIEINAIQAEH